jgi:carbonic anhydrase
MSVKELFRRYHTKWLTGKCCRKFNPEGADIIPPSLGVAIVCCMDARVDPYDIFCLNIGECHVIRNAGAIVNEDTERCLIISQEALGTSNIILMRHKDCGMTKFLGVDMKTGLAKEVGSKPYINFDDTNLKPSEAALREDVVRLYQNPYIRHKNIIACIYDDCTGEVYKIDTSCLKRYKCKSLNPENPPMAITGVLPLYKPKNNGMPGGDIWDPNSDDIKELSVCFNGGSSSASGSEYTCDPARHCKCKR